MPEPDFQTIAIEDFEPNPWNANAMDDAMFQKAIESIHKFGFVDPLTVRDHEDKAQIVDGEHRWRAGTDHSEHCTQTTHVGYRTLPAFNLGVIPDAVAKQLTIVLNETRGEYEPKKMGQLLTDLLVSEPMPELLALLPFSKPKFEELAALPKVDWNQLSSGSGGGGKRSERWVERVYRMPLDAAEKLDEAIVTWRDREGVDDGSAPDWQALRALAEDFLGS